MIIHRSRLVQAVNDKVLNRRGYKRIIPYDECYQILRSIWESISPVLLSITPGSSSFFSSLPSDLKQLESLEKEAESELQASLDKYLSTFSVSPEKCLNLEQYKYLEYVPYIAGVGVLRTIFVLPNSFQFYSQPWISRSVFLSSVKLLPTFTTTEDGRSSSIRRCYTCSKSQNCYCFHSMFRVSCECI